MPMRYLSRLCCSIDMALSGGRSRCASQMLKPTEADISRPKTKKSPIFVQSVVVKTDEYFTDRYQSQSVQNPANMTNAMPRTARTPSVMSRWEEQPPELQC